MKKNHRLFVARVVVRFVGLAALATVALAARPAQARLIDLRAGGRFGGMVGWGSSSTPDFFDKARGVGGGFELGAKLLVVDLSVNFSQLFEGSSLTQMLLGFTFDIPVGNLYFQDGIAKGKSRNIIRPILNGGFAVGTPNAVDLPLDDAQISQKGFISNFGASYEYFLNPFMAVGAQVDYGWHYFVGGGKSNFTGSQKHSAGYHFDGFATVTFHLGV
jgi:hypothetical protein